MSKLDYQTDLVPAGLPQEPLTFEQHVLAVLPALREALESAFRLLDVQCDAPQDLARRLRLDKSLSWKVARIAREPDPFAAIAHLPGPEGLDILQQALGRSDLPEPVVQRVIDCRAAFEALVTLHAGDRGTLEVMAGQFARDRQRHLLQMESHRRWSYRGNSATWGVSARMQLSAQFVLPSATPGRLDLAVAAGLFDFRRLRPDVTWAVSQVRRYQDNDNPLSAEKFEAVDPDYGDVGRVPLLPEFCSSPLPPLRIVRSTGGLIRFELAEGEVGNTAAMTTVLAWTYRGLVPRYLSDVDKVGQHFVTLSTPAEAVVHEVWVHRDVAVHLPPRSGLFNLLPAGPLFKGGYAAGGELPLPCEVEPVGRLSEAAMTDLPQHARIVQRVMDRLQQPADAFTGYRLRLKYPPIPTMLMLAYDLENPPA